MEDIHRHDSSTVQTPMPPEHRSTTCTSLISKENCNPQEQSPFFSLPAELRALIYDLVIGSGTIHIYRRPCTHRDKYLTSHAATFQRLGLWSGPGSNYFEKSTYAVCQHPQHWEKAYARTNRLNVAPSKHTTPCFEPHVKDLLHVSLATILLDDSLRPEGEQDRRQFEADHVDRLAKVRKRHSHSAIDVGLLPTCRLIYHETRKLPFINYTFDLTDPRADHFIPQVLFHHQATAMQTIRIDDSRNIQQINLFLQAFPNLKNLQFLVVEDKPLAGLQSQFRDFFELNKLQSVQVMTIARERLEARSWKDEKMEIFLTKLENADQEEITKRLRTGVIQRLCVFQDRQP
ncbi:hypothetical protein PRZ48_011447 [Zasmidium cellare]|uniref:DUF7730 domain-containing protein n=1 Tax=Zasmidium cellare TaxID=395010 RepID=A0ABR0E6C9_ZASCE|nr:hypothetical protein PRZ48_011447 [Zasmidium cellare]